MQPFTWSMRAICALAVLSISALNLSAATQEVSAASAAGKSGLLNCGARIECVKTDDAEQRTHAPVVVMNDGSIRCPLNEGDTTFVVTLPRPCMLERLRFVTENVAARGTLSLAVSDEDLAPDSGHWRLVEGSVAFHHKRLFDLSVVGLEAKFVRVTFSVEREMRLGELALAPDGFESARRTLFGANQALAKQAAFGANLTLLSATPLIAALKP
jgi:hypothetical protein